MVTLLHSLITATTLAPRAEQIDSDAAALDYLTAAWEPVATAYAKLAGTVSTGGGIPAS